MLCKDMGTAVPPVFASAGVRLRPAASASVRLRRTKIFPRRPGGVPLIANLRRCLGLAASLTPNRRSLSDYGAKVGKADR